MRSFICFACFALLVMALDSFGSVTVYYNSLNHASARQMWSNAAGPFTTIDFTGFADNTIITTQYTSSGAAFTDNTDRIFLSEGGFPNDGAGLYGAIDTIDVSFAQPTYSIAADYPGSLRITLLWQGEILYTSPDFVNGGTGFFAGLVSDEPFDAAFITDPDGGVFIDDLFFGPPIPAPSGLALLAFGATSALFRRRRT